MSTTDRQFSRLATPVRPEDQELAEPPSEDTKKGHDSQPQLLQLLEQLRDGQKEYLSLQHERWGLARGIPRVAEELWVSGIDAWAGLAENASPSRIYWTPGKKFLERLISSSTHLQRAKSVFERWVTIQNAYSAPWNKDFLLDSMYMRYQTTGEVCEWPQKWNIRDCPDDEKSCCQNNVTHASPSDSRDRFKFGTFSINRSFGIIDMKNAAAIISLVPGNSRSLMGCPEFLDGHIAKWRERPVHDRCGMIEPSVPGPDRASMESFARNQADTLSEPMWDTEDFEPITSVFMHYMRSFVVTNFNKIEKHNKPNTPGLNCLREHITFRGFYDGTMTKLIEKRYSTSLNLLPLQGPSGHFALVSICDGQQSDVNGMFRGSPGGDTYSGHLSELWDRYGIYPAGLYTGILLFQLQVCAFIDSWEQDWTSTIGHIDKMVSLNLDVLENDKHLRGPVFGDSNDDSVLYFKVLRFLNNFSDMVRAAPSYLDTLWSNVRERGAVDDWFLESYPHTEKTNHIIKHNWEIVRQRQRDASNRILEKLERTSNEVKSLQSGLFNVQSITEARKIRILNKYLLVFTIVTILFLPPTFVATFFGMHIFDADTIDATQKIFWLVLGGLSGGTYLIASLGLFGSNLPAGTRKEWGAHFSGHFWSGASALIGNLVAWFQNTKRWIKEKRTQLAQRLNSGSSL